MSKTLHAHLDRWVRAGLMDEATASRIREFEAAEAPTGKTRWAAALAWGLGALLIGVGIISFIGANWQEMTQPSRMALILILTIGFHVAAGLLPHLPAFQLALHGMGTVSLGAGIGLAGQIFNLDSGWNGWMLLWAIGAACGYSLIRDWLQLVLAALLLPLWIHSEWSIRGPGGHDTLPLLCLWLGVMVLYFLSAHKPLVWLGGIALVPLTIFILVLSSQDSRYSQHTPVAAFWAYLAVIVLLAIVGRFLFGGFQIRGLASIAAVALISYVAADVGGWMVYFILGVAFVALCAWGVSEQRVEMVNVGIAGFAATVLGFFVSHTLSLLGSSLGLILLGLLMLGGGFALEKARRRLLEKLR